MNDSLKKHRKDISQAADILKADNKSSVGRSKNFDKKSTVGSLAKGFRVLEAFSSGHAQMTISDVSRVTGLDSGTVFRNLNTLFDLGYLERDDDSKQFRLSLKVLDLGFHAIGRSDIRDLVLPILRELVSQVGEAASLGVLEGGDILYLERVRAGVARLGVDIRVGTRVPAYCSVVGQALLAFLPQKEQKKILQDQQSHSDLGIVPLSDDEVLRSLEVIQKDGYALKGSYFNSSLHVFATPVFDRDNYPIASVSVAAPSLRISQAEMLDIAFEPVMSAVKKISKALRASGSIASVLNKNRQLNSKKRKTI